MIRRLLVSLAGVSLAIAAIAADNSPVDVVQSASDEMLAALDGKRDY